jgi:hypothetical protein
MSKLFPPLALVLAALVGAAEGRAQPSPVAPAARASLTVKTQLTIGGTKYKVLRKRLYLFNGIKDTDRDPLRVNDELNKRIRTATIQSRDCFYCSQGATAAYIAWLQLKDCETPYCREITADDVQKVPEFADAYKQALIRYKNKPDLARRWLTPFLPAGRRDGYYLLRKQAEAKTLGGVVPLATVMTDPSQGQANFIDILLSKPEKLKPDSKDATQPFVLSNVVPIELGGKFYTWICTVNLKAGSNAITLPVATNASCEVTVSEVPKCATGGCKQ